MRQRWHDLLFAHWPMPAGALAALVPPTLALDTFDGRGWLGVVPFHMSGIRARGLPPVPGLSAFPELNVRTYVRRGGRPGVLFLSLDAGSRVAVEAARALYHLPYYHAAMTVLPEGDGVRYASRRVDRRGAPAAWRGRYGPAGAAFQARPGSLEHWLTERYCLYAPEADGRLYQTEIHHAPWPLQPATAAVLEDTMVRAAGLPGPEGPGLLHFARRLDVVVWAPRRLT
jgi:uncharacterized protein YqjF (DUF2071 family)